MLVCAQSNQIGKKICCYLLLTVCMERSLIEYSHMAKKYSKEKEQQQEIDNKCQLNGKRL